MEWKFWQKDRNPPSHEIQSMRLTRPKNLPREIGLHLILQEQFAPDWIWRLKCVLRPRSDAQTRFDFRIFSYKAVCARGLRVMDFDSLNDHPELVIFHGWFDSRTHELEINKTPKMAA